MPPARPRPSPAPDLATECDERSPGTVALGLRGSATEQRPWLAGAPVVPALTAHGIAHAGVLTCPAPFRIVRTRLSGAYFMATTGGTGLVYLDGRWTPCAAGQAVLLMPGVLNAFTARPGEPWSQCWVRFAPGATTSGPADRMQIITHWEAGPLRHALLGLREAALTHARPALLQRWAELVWQNVNEFRHAFAPDPRLVRLWEAVAADLAAPWPLPAMAARAALSPEQLRRLCRTTTGRSPREHLRHLRMKRAAELLLTTDWTTDRIAEAVGYANAFAFSAAFKKAIGWPPTSYAQRASSSARHVR